MAVRMSDTDNTQTSQLTQLMGRVFESNACEAFGDFVTRRIALGDLAPMADDALLDGIDESPDGGAAMAEAHLSSLTDDARDALLDELGRAALAEPWEMPPDVVTMNSRVRFSFDGAEEEVAMTLTYPKDMGANADQLSILTPVGTALLADPGAPDRIADELAGLLAEHDLTRPADAVGLGHTVLEGEHA